MLLDGASLWCMSGHAPPHRALSSPLASVTSTKWHPQTEVDRGNAGERDELPPLPQRSSLARESPVQNRALTRWLVHLHGCHYFQATLNVLDVNVLLAP